MAFTSIYERGLKLFPSNERAGRHFDHVANPTHVITAAIVRYITQILHRFLYLSPVFSKCHVGAGIYSLVRYILYHILVLQQYYCRILKHAHLYAPIHTRLHMFYTGQRPYAVRLAGMNAAVIVEYV